MYCFSAAWRSRSKVWYSANVSAVTGACQLISKRLFHRLGGFDEGYQLCYSDVVLCLQAWKSGYRVVMVPGARLIHHQCSTRNSAEPQNDVHRFAEYLRDNNLTEDRFFHPELTACLSTPTLRPAREPTSAELAAELIGRYAASALRTAKQKAG